MVGILSRPTWYKYPSMKHALVTGGAGFIGSHLVDSLLADGWRVTVFDNFDPFYDAAIKERNVGAHLRHPAFTPVRGDLRDRQSVTRLSSASYDVIVHLAARAGVRPSIEDPVGYQDVNVGGTQLLLELARTLDVRQFVFASSSSVYGMNPRVPWREDDHVLHPIARTPAPSSVASSWGTSTATCMGSGSSPSASSWSTDPGSDRISPSTSSRG
jgi:UDP-glucuronate 4-epimerase